MRTNPSRTATWWRAPLVYSLALGMSVSDGSGKAIATLATEELKHPAPVFHTATRCSASPRCWRKYATAALS
jgi:hypothetical protein